MRERATEGCRCLHPTRADYTQLMAPIYHSYCCGHASHPRIIVPFFQAALIGFPQVSLCLYTRDMMITKRMTEDFAGIASNRSKETVSTRNVSIVPPISKNKEWQGKWRLEAVPKQFSNGRWSKRGRRRAENVFPSCCRVSIL